MKKGITSLVLIGLSLVLAACSLNTGVASLYKEESPLHADIQIPASFKENVEDVISIALEQNGERVENPEFLHAEIWKQDGSLSFPMEEVEQDENGAFYVKKDFDEDGLYFIKLHASSNGSIITPKKQFIVGELSDEELEILQEGAQEEEVDHEHHH
ncbi:hypothetical protein BN988_02071 [Oceanobacillus picturae]|uniref:YtkA-like domain-containing protein n=1 Tax=Oceanobacillus picturae TaxID=171693 RepID=W9BAV6_9BACI|nr:FixH family protein [Oceanobacillus picturae]CDO03555.1 hypothetical protein BN988_02071 [Oceanobacillus picturae]